MRVGLFQQGGVHDVGGVHASAFLGLEVQLEEFCLTLSDAFNEGLLLTGKFKHVRFDVGVVLLAVGERGVLVIVVCEECLVLVELVHQRVVPGSVAVDSSYVGVLKGVPLLCEKDVFQDVQVAQREGGDVHVGVEVLVQAFHVKRGGRCGMMTIFLWSAGCQQCCQQ